MGLTAFVLRILVLLTHALTMTIGAYCLIASFIFFWIPLSYFYFEELADDEQTLLQRLWASFRYTVFFILVAAILLLTGLLMKPDRHEDIDLDWLRKILADPGRDLSTERFVFITPIGILRSRIDFSWFIFVCFIDGTGALSFVAGIMALAGMGVLVFYTVGRFISSIHL